MRYQNLLWLLIFVQNVIASPDVFELLNKRECKLENMKSFMISLENQASGASNHQAMREKGRTTYITSHATAHSDGNRYSMRLDRWIGMESADEILNKNSESYHYNRELFDGVDAFSFTSARKDTSKIKHGMLIKEKSEQTKFTPDNGYLSIFLGDYGSDGEGVEKVLAKARGEISVKENMQKVGDWECYVIDANTNYGKYRLWIDPSHGYNIAKAIVKKQSGDILKIAQGGKMTDGMSTTSTYTVTKFEQVDGLWIPVEATDTGGSTWPGGGYSKGTSSYKITAFELNPDHEKLGSFVLDDIPNGTTAMVTGIPAEYFWQDGELVPDVEDN